MTIYWISPRWYRWGQGRGGLRGEGRPDSPCSVLLVADRMQLSSKTHEHTWTDLSITTKFSGQNPKYHVSDDRVTRVKNKKYRPEPGHGGLPGEGRPDSPGLRSRCLAFFFTSRSRGVKSSLALVRAF